MTPQLEADLVAQARRGDRAAFESLVAPLRGPLRSYICRMITSPQDADDLLQEVMVRGLESVAGFRRESGFKTWLFGIATHVCLDHLRARKRWRAEAQLAGEREAEGSSDILERMQAIVAQPDFLFEIREHIAFCFTCVARTLEPEEQAALMLREVLGFSNEESASILSLSEPVFRHRLSGARSAMTKVFDGLCTLINKTGHCYQCRGLREWVPRDKRGADLVQIEVAPGVAVTPDSLLDARLEIVRGADPEGRTAPLHRYFYAGISHREESR